MRAHGTTLLLRDGLVDLRARRVWRAGRVARLSEAETEILGLLVRNVGQNVDRQQLLVEALHHHPSSRTRAVDLCVFRLRAKLERDPSAPQHLLTVHNAGYRFVPADAVEEVRTNVAPPRTPMLGRDGLKNDLRSRLDDGPVTLIGPAGVGKTRIAQAVAIEAARTWAPAGAWWVEVSHLAGVDAIVRALAQTAGVEAGPVEELARRLQDRGPSLVVLDTCERCPSDAALVAAALGPETRVLLSSRVPIVGTTDFEVDPLDELDAVALLHQRASEAGVLLPLDDEGVQRLVASVDRLPLAIELAAARLPAMSLQRIARELAQPLRLLRGPGDGRLASIEASIRWSWDALSDADRHALILLATFRGPASDAATSALLPEGAVDRLVGFHLVRRTSAGVIPWHAVRELVEATAEPEHWSAALAAHDQWWSEAAERWTRALTGPGCAAALSALEAGEPDLAAADARGADSRVALARAELDFECGRYPALIPRLDALVSSDDDPRRTALRILAAAASGRRGDWADAQVRAEAALIEATTLRDRVEAQCVISNALARRNLLPEARDAAERAARLAGDDPYLRSRAAAAQVLVAFIDWRPEESLAVAQRALQTIEAAGVQRYATVARHNLAVALMRSGRLAEAQVALEAAASAPQRNPRAAGITLMNLAVLRFAEDPNAALIQAELALERFRDCGAADGERAMLGMSGMCKVLLGDVTDGLADLDEEQSRLADGAGPLATNSRLLRGSIFAYLGRLDEARAQFDRVRAVLARDFGISQADADALEAAWLDGTPLSADALARFEAVDGDRRWVQARLLRWCERT